MPAILQKAVEKTRDCVVEFLENLMSRIYKFTALADKIIFVKELIPFDVYTKENVNWAIEMLSASRQQEIYIRCAVNDDLSIISKINL